MLVSDIAMFVLKRDVKLQLTNWCFLVLMTNAMCSSVSEMSDENMMDASNLAICFGPTLMPVPDDQDQVFCQTYVNELIKNIIIHYETVFPFDGGVIYERFILPGEGYVLLLLLLLPFDDRGGMVVQWVECWTCDQ